MRATRRDIQSQIVHTLLLRMLRVGSWFLDDIRGACLVVTEVGDVERARMGGMVLLLVGFFFMDGSEKLSIGLA